MSHVSCLADIPDYIARLQPAPRVISLDVFDTVLWRLVSPERSARMALSLLQKRFRTSGFATFNLKTAIEQRRAYTQQRELQARRSGQEWSIAEWYEQFASDYGEAVESIVEWGLEAELASETLCTRRARHAKQLVETLRGRGHRVVATSDTQLPHDLLSSLLEAHDLSFDAVFSSSSTGHSKRWGDMFSFLLQKWELPASRIVHVGDHWKGDLVRAVGSGCRAIWLPRSRRSPPPNPRLSRALSTSDQRRVEEVWRALDVQAADTSRHLLYRLAFDWIAPVLAIAALWQWQHFKRLDISTAFFIARDGEAFLEVYELLEDALPDSPTRHYLHLSRQAVALAHPDNLLQSFSNVGGKSPRKTVDDFFGQFALPSELEDKLLKTAELERDAHLTRPHLASLQRSVGVHKAAINAIQHEQRQLLAGYMRQFGDLRDARVGLVDTGWSGTIQDTLRAVLPEPKLIGGLYLGVSSHGHTPSRASVKCGLLRDDYATPPAANMLERTAGVIRLWEILLSNEEPTTTRLARANRNEIRPVYGDVTERGPDQKRALRAIRRGILDGVQARVAGVRALARIGRKWPTDVWRTAASLGSRRFTCMPKRPEASQLLELDYEDNLTHGTRVSIDLDGFANGTVWYPGVAAKYGCARLQGVLEWLTLIIA